MNWKGTEWFHINIMFPDRFKEIVSVKAVDIHSAIGNSGGYVGLLLGNYHYNNKEYFKRIRKKQLNNCSKS